MSPAARRQLLAVVVGAAGVLLLTASAGHDWARGLARPPAPLPEHVVGATGSALAGGARALGFAAAAGVVAGLAVRPRWRRVLSVLVVAASGGAMAGCVVGWRDAGGRARALGAVPGTVHLSAWPWAALAGAGLLVVAGLLLFRTGAAGGLGARFDRPAAEDTGQPSLGRGRAADPVAAAWEALDRGEDPTA